MMRRLFLHALFVLTVFGMGIQAADRPNFVWLISEDNSIHYLKLYDEHGAETPRIAELAERGLVFEHAFSNSPVCSVARTTLMTGCLAPRIGTQFHRKTVTVPLPAGLRMFPAYLRDQGYYTSNNRKKDYNAIEGDGVWDESSGEASWRKRSPDQPFFHMQSFGTTHESSLHFNNLTAPTNTEVETVFVAPYHPDTATFRYTNARYRDNIQQVDAQIGAVIDQLKEDQLLEDTFVFYFGDHGGVLPRSKGYAYESGLHVPLVIRVPEKWRHLVEASGGGRRRQGFVSFVDFGPTLLHLAGISIPSQMDGRPFLGESATLEEVIRRDEAYGYADRFDEKYDFVRTLRKGPWKYMRSYQPFNVDALQNNYRYRMLAYQEWRDLYDAGELNERQRQFFEGRPAEALFDIVADPHETVNLASNIRYKTVLEGMRQRLREIEQSLPDLSFYPEPFLVQHAFDDPVKFGKRYQGNIAELISVADLSLRPFQDVKQQLLESLRSSDRWKRYWGLIASSSHGQADDELVQQAKQLAAEDEENLVRVRAAEFLGLVAGVDPAPVILESLQRAPTGVEACLIMNSLVLLRDGPKHFDFDVPPDLTKPNPGKAEFERRMAYLHPASE